ncbi:glycosyl transferase family 9 [Hymenobacter roseosalivarius DSM 11622]|uniref:Glycosyl transferase family 9 n=1 Tax=Hymenobacter roseosalivarius DSM 11622 TaxID=645990 RepID=A0A1W1VS44_9BACT|nr:glycosyltransferase family 9 protein [Hymenobacter roseosalivarius]SMB96168.1 glycosyl transferase family 9 [Hymenobacter roseosalivarius DSM 11622]
MKTFLVSRTDAIGDVVLTLPVCGQLKRLFPGCRVVLIGRTYTQAVAEACPQVDGFINVDELLKSSPRAQVAALRAEQAAAIIHVFPNKSLARLARQADIPIRIGTRNRWFHWLTCNRLVALSRRHSPLHEAQLNLRMLAPLSTFKADLPLAEVAALSSLQPVETLGGNFSQLLQARKAGQLNIILHPSSRGSAREWGLDHFGTLAYLLHQAGHRVFITGTTADGEMLRPWLTAHASSLTADLTGQLSLPQLLAFIHATDGLVAASTGPLHLAAALGRHALGVYPSLRPTDPGRWAPLGPHAEYLVFDRPNCTDCRMQPALCTCVRAIQPAQVLARISGWQPLAISAP